MPMDLSPREHWADAAVHAAGVCLGLAGAVVLLVEATVSPRSGQVAPACIYAVGLVAMLGCSAVYNLWRTCRRREWLRRLDHAAIFVMIAGTYTPLTVRLPGGWAVGLTAGIWSLALFGVIAKICQPRRIEAMSVGLYLALGWAGVVALGPLLSSFSGLTLALILAGGLVYSAGVVFHLATSLPYARALWHGCVLLAAGIHYAAQLTILSV